MQWTGQEMAVSRTVVSVAEDLSLIDHSLIVISLCRAAILGESLGRWLAVLWVDIPCIKFPLQLQLRVQLRQEVRPLRVRDRERHLLEPRDPQAAHPPGREGAAHAGHPRRGEVDAKQHW